MKDVSKTYSITSNYDNIDWNIEFPKLLPVLMSYAFFMIGSSNLRVIKNREELSYDFSMEAIKRYIENPNKFDPSRNKDLVLYLKRNILRRLISNFKNLHSQKNEFLYELDDSIGKKVIKSFIDYNEIYDDIDYKELIKNIELELSSDKNLFDIFEYRIKKEYKRSEVCDVLNIELKDYNNRIRRLRTVIKRFINSKIKVV